MPTFSMTKSYADGNVLNESDLDNMKTSTETFLNTTKLDADNLQDSAISTAKIAANAVTQAKRVALGQQLSSATGSYTNATTSYTDVTNATVTITTTGRPVFIALIPDGGASNASFDSNDGTIKLMRDSTDIAFWNLIGTSTIAHHNLLYIDAPATGTYVYKLRAKMDTAANTVTVDNMKLIAFEL